MIDVVIPVYTRSLLTQRLAVESIAQLRANTMDIRIIVVDNGWHEDRPRDFSADTYIRLQENQGYAGGVNAGLERTTTDIVVVSSIDVFVSQGWLEPMAGLAWDRGGIASPAAVRVVRDTPYGTPEGMEVPDCAFWGGIFAMPREVYETIGGLDEQRFPLRFSDVDYAIRACKAGYWVGRATDVVVEHRDPSLSSAFMSEEGVAAERALLQEVYGEFPLFSWTQEHWV